MQAAPSYIQSIIETNDDDQFDVLVVRGDLFTDTLMPMAIGILDDTHSSALNQIQDSCGLFGDMV